MSLILQENKRRNAILDAEYNPYLGIGSTIERQQIILNDYDLDLWLPVSMMNIEWIQKLAEKRNVKDFINKHRYEYEQFALSYHPIDKVQELFFDERLNHDFEFWCALCAKIKPKKGGDFTNFILNYPQRLLWAELYEMIESSKPIFFMLLKSRQFGGSTMIDILSAFIQIRLKTNWNSLIAAHINQGATNIRSMTTNLFKFYPTDIDDISLKPFEGTHNIKIIPERSNKITIGSMETPDSIRTDDLKIAHVSEFGLMKKTQGKSPEDLIQSIIGTLPMDEPYTMFAIESTAKGVGNAFHRMWQQAVSGKNGMKPIFIPWLKDQKNRIDFKKGEDIQEFFDSLDDYEKFLWQSGATLEGINFYRRQLGLFSGDKWRMQSEFPTTAEEAFQSTGNRYFPAQYVLALRKDNKEPIWKGEIVGDSTMGKKALENIRLEKNERGNLWIWEMPDEKNQYDFRYVVSMDIGGTTDKADYSVIRAFDRLPMLEGNDPKTILTWKSHIDQDLLAWKGVQISKLCDNALFVPEDNSMEKEEDGEHFQTILDTIKDDYRWVYIRNNVENVGSEFVPKYGWNTNKKSKGLALDALKTCARERMNKDNDKQDGFGYVEYDERLCSEMDCMEIKQNGSVGSVDGEHDDLCMTTAIGLRVAIYEMPLPRLRKTEAPRRVERKRIESSF